MKTPTANFCKSAGVTIPGLAHPICPAATPAVNYVMQTMKISEGQTMVPNHDPQSVGAVCCDCLTRLIRVSSANSLTFATIDLVSTWHEISIKNGTGLEIRSRFHLCSLKACKSNLIEAQADHVRFGETAYPICSKCAPAARLASVRYTDGRLYPRSLAAIRDEIKTEREEADRKALEREQAALAKMNSTIDPFLHELFFGAPPPVGASRAA